MTTGVKAAAIAAALGGVRRNRSTDRNVPVGTRYGLVKCRDGGAAASWFSEMRANARPARRAGPIVRLPLLARRGPTKEAHRRALNRVDGLQRSVAGQGHARFLRVTLPRERPDLLKRAVAGSHCPLTP